MILQEALASLRADVDAILDVRLPEPKASPVELAEDTVLAALFTTITAPLPPPHERAKRHHSNRTSENKDAWATKKKRQIWRLRGETH